VADGDLHALRSALTAAGFEARGHEWVLFADRRAQGVDLLPVTGWKLRPEVVTRLLADARPLPGAARLRAPSAHDALLLLAHRSLGVHAALTAKHRRRIAALLEDDPDAWAMARGRAAAWGVSRRLAALEASFAASGGLAPAALAVRAATENAGADACSSARAVTSVLRSRAPIPSRRGAIVAVSGIDGSGKSTQAEALTQALADLGHEATVGWSRITYDTALRKLGSPAKWILAKLERARGVAPPTPVSEDRWVSTIGPDGAEQWTIALAPGDATARALRERFRTLDRVWTTLVAVVHGATQRRRLEPELWAGRIVVRDRYLLDAVVQLGSAYGRGEPVRAQARLLRILCPHPVASFWIDVDPETAYMRKPEEYTVSQLATHHLGYAAEAKLLEVVRIDGTLPPEVVAALIARETWRRLG